MMNRIACSCCLWVLLMGIPSVLSVAQSARGKAEFSATGGKIVIDYGRPLLKGRDPFTWQQEGSYWRMGSNDMTTITTPEDLAFGSTRLPRGTYGMWLLKLPGGRYELVFNSVTTGMGMSHDKTKDVASVPLIKEDLAAPVETFTMQLAGSGSSGRLTMSWGSARLASDFQVAR